MKKIQSIVFLVCFLLIGYGCYIEARAWPFSNKIKPLVRSILISVDTYHIWGGYWENRMLSVIEEAADLEPEYRAELYIAIITLVDLDASRGYLFLTEVAKDQEGQEYLMRSFRDAKPFPHLSTLNKNLVIYWVTTLEKYQAIEGQRLPTNVSP